MPDKMAQFFHRFFRKPNDARYSRLDTLADELEKLGVPRGIIILALYPLFAIVSALAVAVAFAALWDVWEHLAEPLLTELVNLLSPISRPVLQWLYHTLQPLGFFGAVVVIFLAFCAICAVVGAIQGLRERRSAKPRIQDKNAAGE